MTDISDAPENAQPMTWTDRTWHNRRNLHQRWSYAVQSGDPHRSAHCCDFGLASNDQIGFNQTPGFANQPQRNETKWGV